MNHDMEDQLAAYFKFLDDLRESGATNMYGARPYLLREFPSLTRQEALEVCSIWMTTFDTNKDVEERVTSAIQILDSKATAA